MEGLGVEAESGYVNIFSPESLLIRAASRNVHLLWEFVCVFFSPGMSGHWERDVQKIEGWLENRKHASHLEGTCSWNTSHKTMPRCQERLMRPCGACGLRKECGRLGIKAGAYLFILISCSNFASLLAVWWVLNSQGWTLMLTPCNNEWSMFIWELYFVYIFKHLWTEKWWISKNFSTCIIFCQHVL